MYSEESKKPRRARNILWGNIMKFIRAEKLKEKPADESKLGFGKIFTDYMLTMKYSGGRWEEPVIEPYGPVPFDLATTVFHYAQGIFEGLKAFRNAAGEVRVFRPEENFKRMNRSAERMCIPQIDEKVVLDGLFELLKIEKDWIVYTPGVIPALYWAVGAFTKPDEKVLVQSPVYYVFYNAIAARKREVVCSELVQSEAGYHIDFEDLEKELSDPSVKLMIFCSCR